VVDALGWADTPETVQDHDRPLNTVSGGATQQGLHGNLVTAGQGRSEGNRFGQPGSDGLAVTHLGPSNRRREAQQRRQRGAAQRTSECAAEHHARTPESDIHSQKYSTDLPQARAAGRGFVGDKLSHPATTIDLNALRVAVHR
jgi:hypothetical protein